jgi:hypothetical protein
MDVDDLLPYPLAGADSQPGQTSTDASDAAAGRFAARWVRPVAAVVVLVLLGLSLWLAGQWRAERQRSAALQEELAQARASAEQAQAAARDAVSNPLTVDQAFSAEMTVASIAVGRFLQEVERTPSSATPRVFVAAFFGVGSGSTAWTRLEGRYGTSGVLASIDDPDNPGLVWVSRRSSETTDPLVPSRRFCLQLDVARILQSAGSGRQWGAGADTAPLRWWSDVYAFVPAEQCGP